MSLEELEQLYEGMIGQSELPPMPDSYREPELLSSLSPILSVSDNNSDNSDLSPVTPLGGSGGEHDSSDTSVDVSLFSTGSADDIVFVKQLSDIRPVQNDLCHFVCQVNRREPPPPATSQRRARNGSQFEWYLNDERVELAKCDELGLTLIDHEHTACLIIADVMPRHAGRWSCVLGCATTSANLTIQPGEKTISHLRYLIFFAPRTALDLTIRHS